jgi:hypothetical protein
VPIFQGTSDLSRYNALPKALDFYDSLGGRAKMVAYAGQLLDFAVGLICDALGTRPQQVTGAMPEAHS